MSHLYQNTPAARKPSASTVSSEGQMYKNVDVDANLNPIPPTSTTLMSTSPNYQNEVPIVPKHSNPPPSPKYDDPLPATLDVDVSLENDTKQIAPSSVFQEIDIHDPNDPIPNHSPQASGENAPTTTTTLSTQEGKDLNRYTVFEADKIHKDSLPSSRFNTLDFQDLKLELKQQQPDTGKLPSKNIGQPEPDADDHFKYLSHEIEDIPSWSSTIGLGFQVYLMMVATSVSLPVIIMGKMCIQIDDPKRSEIVSTFVFVSGIITILQSSFGTRLPIVQGGSSAFMMPTLAILGLEMWKCPKDVSAFSKDEREELWQLRMREIQGAIIVSSLFQVFIGFSGLIGIILPYLTPITIASSVTMIGLSLFGIAGQPAGKNWWISVATIVMIIIFSQYLKNLRVPIPFTTSPKRDGMKRYQIFQRLPILLGMVAMWIVCWFLTLSDALPEGDPGRTDLPETITIWNNTQWFYVPVPFQWGAPTVSTGAVFGMLAGVLAGIVESIGDYYATARIVGAKAPPIHAINRGILVEGIGCIVAGIWGTGNGTTSYSENIGAIGITQIGSRRVIQIGGLLMIIFSLFCKLNAFFVTIPEPITGAFLIVIFGTLTAAGISNLKGVDLNSPRNMFVIGFSVFFALTVSQWMNQWRNAGGAIKTGSDSLDHMLTVFLSTGMFLGGFVAFVLDNTVPGSRKERGMEEWEKHFVKKIIENADEENPNEDADGEITKRDDSYDLPFIMEALHKSKVAKWMPISPTFQSENYERLFMDKLRFRVVANGFRNATKVFRGYSMKN